MKNLNRIFATCLDSFRRAPEPALDARVLTLPEIERRLRMITHAASNMEADTPLADVIYQNARAALILIEGANGPKRGKA